MRQLTDQDEFPIGQLYHGRKMEDVPAGHLLWWWDDAGLWDARNWRLNGKHLQVRDYILRNFTALETECKNRIIKHRPEGEQKPRKCASCGEEKLVILSDGKCVSCKH
jgi:hypothetical protein